MGCFPNSNGWAGVPLISTAANRRSRKHFLNTINSSNRHSISNSVDFDENAMSRLAIHAHGAPLILSGRQRTKNTHKKDQNKHLTSTITFYNGNMEESDKMQCSVGKNLNRCNNNISSNYNNMQIKNCSNNNTNSITTNNGVRDTMSVNSDESSNSSNGNVVEMCLPRIIKPRKRRKKDRKPMAAAQYDTNSSANCSTINNTQSCDADQNLINNSGYSNLDTDHTNDTLNIDNIYDGILSTLVGKENSVTFATSDHLTTTTDNSTINNDINNNIIISNKNSINDDSSNKEETSSCSCRLCDPSCHIWAFPLRRACTDPSDIESHTNKNVGVIGSNRIGTVRNEWRSSSSQLIDTEHNINDLINISNFESTRKESLSDSGDSGCDILSGLNFTEDILSSGTCFNANNNPNGLSPPSSSATATHTDNFEFKFPNTAVLFSESINEISRKMMENMDLSSVSSDNSSVFSDSVFSDEYLMNLDAFSHPCGIFNFNSNMNNSGTNQNDKNYFNFNIYNNTNSTSLWNDHETSVLKNQSLFNDSLSCQEKDRGDEVINCFDMVWNGSKLLPVKE